MLQTVNKVYILWIMKLFVFLQFVPCASNKILDTKKTVDYENYKKKKV